MIAILLLGTRFVLVSIVDYFGVLVLTTATAHLTVGAAVRPTKQQQKINLSGLV